MSLREAILSAEFSGPDDSPGLSVGPDPRPASIRIVAIGRR